jgi:hypothetical protein
VKQYYTLIQEFIPTNDRNLCDYLDEQGIQFDVGAEFTTELKEVGYRAITDGDKLMRKCTVLIEEHELSAIMLSVGGVTVVGNRPFVDMKNKVRGWFKWMS